MWNECSRYILEQHNRASVVMHHEIAVIIRNRRSKLCDDQLFAASTKKAAEKLHDSCIKEGNKITTSYKHSPFHM